jgi:hypothetical protein
MAKSVRVDSNEPRSSRARNANEKAGRPPEGTARPQQFENRYSTVIGTVNDRIVSLAGAPFGTMPEIGAMQSDCTVHA